MGISPNVLLVSVLARLLEGRRNVLIGTNSPAPGAAALLAQQLAGDSMKVTIIGSDKYSALTDDLAEIFDSATQGRFDAFFLGGGQIDGQANINLVGIGEAPKFKVRWPGSHGTPLLYMMIPNSVLFREEHTKRTLVPKVDFISAAGVSEPNVFRPGGPVALLTSRCLFRFDKPAQRFRLASVHPGHTVDEVRDNTGFDYDIPADVPVTPLPTRRMLELLRHPVAGEVVALFPQFAEALARDVDAALLTAA